MKYLFKVIIYLLLPFTYDAIAYFFYLPTMKFFHNLFYYVWFFVGIVLLVKKINNEYIQKRLSKK